MNALNDVFWSGIGGASQASRVRVWDTHWGFTVSRTLAGSSDPAILAETAMKLAGMLMLPASGIVLFLPQIENRTGQLTISLGMIAAFVAIGFAIYIHADKGFRTKIQIDPSRREVRIGTQNAKGRFHLKSTYPVSDIESFFIARSKNPGAKARLMMRIRSAVRTVPLFEDHEANLVPVLERIVLSLRPPKMKNRRIRTQTTGQFIRMSFN